MTVDTRFIGIYDGLPYEYQENDVEISLKREALSVGRAFAKPTTLGQAQENACLVVGQWQMVGHGSSVSLL